MAESLRAKIEEQLQCAICLESFRDPRVLPCLHTYCLKCIAKLDMTWNILTCPECRLTSKVPSPPDVSFLPSNFFAKNILATLSQASDSGSGLKRASSKSKEPGVKKANPKPKEAPTISKPKPQNPPKPPKSVFPPGSFVGDRIFRYGYHHWSVDIDHSECLGCECADFEIGVISKVDGSIVAFHGFIKPGFCEDFSMVLDMPNQELSVEPSWRCDPVLFDLYVPLLFPYLRINCETCQIAVTDANFHWHFNRQ